MNINIWLDSLQRASIEGAIAIAAVWVFSRLFHRIPAWAQCWLYRVTFAKILLSLTALAIALPLLKPEPKFEVRPDSIGIPLSAPGPSESPRPAITPSKISGNHVAPQTILLGMWSFGVALSLLFLFRQFRAARKIRSSAQLAPDELVSAAERVATQFRVRKPQVFVSETVSRPLLLGAVRPAIIFPARLEAGEAELSLMLAHELAHAKRRDLAWNWLAAAVQSIFWFHPIVWIGAREWRLAQEMAADEFALRNQPQKASQLGKILLDLVSQQNVPAPRLLAAGIIETKSTLERRLNGMKLIQQGKRWPAMLAFAAIAFAILAALPIKLVAQKHPEETKAPLAKPPAETADDTRLTNVAQDTERSLLVKELAIVEEDLSRARKQYESGVISSEEVMSRQRDFQHLKRELAEMDSDRKAYLDSLESEIALVKNLKTTEEARFKTGVGSNSDLMKTERELLQLQRKLAAAKKGLAGEPKSPSPLINRLRNRHNLDLYAVHDGVVSQLNVKVGDHVKEGQILFAVDLPEAQIRLKTAEAELQMAEADFSLKKLEIDRRVEGEQRAAEHVNAAVSPTVALRAKFELQRAQAEVDIVRAKVEQAKLEMNACAVEAPHSGTVDVIYSMPGRRVTTAGPVVRLAYEENSERDTETENPNRP